MIFFFSGLSLAGAGEAGDDRLAGWLGDPRAVSFINPYLGPMENQSKTSLRPPGSFPLYLLIQITGKPIKMEPDASRSDSSIFPYQNQ